jgi:hypothetical protein
MENSHNSIFHLFVLIMSRIGHVIKVRSKILVMVPSLQYMRIITEKLLGNSSKSLSTVRIPMTLLMPTSHLPSVRNAAEIVFMAQRVEQHPHSIVGRGKRRPGIRQYICYFNARRHPQRVTVPIILRFCGAKNCFNMICHRQLGDEVRLYRPTR